MGEANNVRVTVWNEFRHEKRNEDVKRLYPDGMHATIRDGLLKHDGISVHTATLEEPEHGLTEAVLQETDVLIWWAHMAHRDVSDEVVKRVQKHVLEGMGIIFLHSAHFSKIFKSISFNF